MKSLKKFLEETVEFRGTNSPIVILDGKGELKPNEEELQLLNTKFHGLRVLGVQSEKRLYIGNQFKETHESIANRFPLKLKSLLPIKSSFYAGRVFPLIADSLSTTNKFVLTDSIFSSENSPFTGKSIDSKIKLLETLLQQWNWLDALCDSYTFQETSGQKQDQIILSKLQKSKQFSGIIKSTPLSIGLWVTSGLLSQLSSESIDN